MVSGIYKQENRFGLRGAIKSVFGFSQHGRREFGQKRMEFKQISENADESIYLPVGHIAAGDPFIWEAAFAFDT